ncbi:putative cleavage induced protein [Thraustotheca clavata]|uniref:Putative cleavage induced protein n=1 Tax=Thraustotheca clavata TaxID=74557 RepID=A0A1V9Y9P7_9STRA|nr:putative cleavage induced protein [Thraustotheca clavata]
MSLYFWPALYIRSKHYGTNDYDVIVQPPLSCVKNTSLNFFQFQHIWTCRKTDGSFTLERLIGWANPTLISLLRYNNITLFVDGTFRIVPRGFKLCVVLMVLDKGTQLYIPIFYILTTSKSHNCYWN